MNGGIVASALEILQMAETDSRTTAPRILAALAKVTCCPYGKCQESRVRAHGDCRAEHYRVSAQMKIDGLARMGIILQEQSSV